MQLKHVLKTCRRVTLYIEALYRSLCAGVLIVIIMVPEGVRGGGGGGPDPLDPLSGSTLAYPLNISFDNRVTDTGPRSIYDVRNTID